MGVSVSAYDAHSAWAYPMALNIHGYRYLKDHLSDAHFGKLIIQNAGSSFVYLCHDGLNGKQSVLWDLWAYIVRKLVGHAAPPIELVHYSLFTGRIVNRVHDV